MNTRVRASGGRLFDISNTIFLSLIILITLYPIYYVLVAFKRSSEHDETYRDVILAKKVFHSESYKHVFAYPMIPWDIRTLCSMCS